MSPWLTLKKRPKTPKEKIFYTLEIGIDDPIDVFLVILIISNVFAVILSSVESIYEKSPIFFDGFEIFSVTIFTIEYILRIWSCTAKKEFSHPIRDRLKYATKPLLIVDLLAILPFYLPILGLDLRFLRILRIFRVLRVLKLERYFDALRTIVKVLKRKFTEILSTFLVTLILLTIAASFMFYIEPQTFKSIPDAMWWGIVTLTTVGYGDVYPSTPVGKFIGAILALLGIGLFGLPAGILASGFLEEIQSKNKNKVKAAHRKKPFRRSRFSRFSL